jgi:hypothetical protein
MKRLPVSSAPNRRGRVARLPLFSTPWPVSGPRVAQAEHKKRSGTKKPAEVTWLFWLSSSTTLSHSNLFPNRGMKNL